MIFTAVIRFLLSFIIPSANYTKLLILVMLNEHSNYLSIPLYFACETNIFITCLIEKAER
jgi:ABC-type uncharacterized transport system permease subunit